jgi:hypothetical protein
MFPLDVTAHYVIIIITTVIIVFWNGNFIREKTLFWGSVYDGYLRWLYCLPVLLEVVGISYQQDQRLAASYEYTSFSRDSAVFLTPP